MSYYIGIDPGITGAIARINSTGTSLRVWNIPTERKTEDSPLEYSLTGLRDVFTQLVSFPGTTAAIEWPVAWPGAFANVARDAENFGRGKAYLEAFLFFYKIPYRRIPPAAWKSNLGLPGKTDPQANVKAAALFDRYYPNESAIIRGPRGGLLSGPLDALLIAHWLRVQGGEGLRGLVEQHGKGSLEMQAFFLTGMGRRGKRSKFPKIDLPSDQE